VRDQHGAGLVLLGPGYLGNGNTGIRRTPGKVTGTQDWLDVGVATNHACAITTANLTLACAGFCWGMGVAGELGNGSDADRFSPVRVFGVGWLSIAAGTAGFALSEVGKFTPVAVAAP